MENKLAPVIRFLYPHAQFWRDYTVRDRSDGNGPFIATWNEERLGPKPDLERLEAVAAGVRFKTWWIVRGRKLFGGSFLP